MNTRFNSINVVAQSIIDREIPDSAAPERGRLHMLLCLAIRAWIDQDLMPTYSLHQRRLALAQHPDSDEPGQVVLVAAFGSGPGIIGGHHELCICMGDEERKRLIEVLQMPPTIEG